MKFLTCQVNFYNSLIIYNSRHEIRFPFFARKMIISCNFSIKKRNVLIVSLILSMMVRHSKVRPFKEILQYKIYNKVDSTYIFSDSLHFWKLCKKNNVAKNKK